MEGADGIREPKEVEFWWEQGVRLIGLAWMGTRYSGGTNQPGPLTSLGRDLLEQMSPFGFGLDLSHMDEEAALQALDLYPGTILASHSNAQALLKGSQSNRHLTDRVIAGLIERDGVIGIVPTIPFLKPGWKQAHGRSAVSLWDVVAQIDYICQMAGSARHVGLGTDYDGGFGWQHVPEGIDTIADLQQIAPLLREKGYTEDDIALILAGNHARMLEQILRES
jgi:membrane dipeptidase